ncbi:MAG: FHA domain-containing protein [Anaerolineales bacterium]|nr:FHA domain-containing protein [Anaerolineales bacterium]
MVRNSDDLPTLVAQTGPLNGQRWMLNDTIVLGRDQSCGIIIPDRQVSRYHARLNVTSNGIELEDLGSKNGTHHNGELIIDPVLLKDGDTVQVALAQQFLYLSADATLPLESAGVEMAPISTVKYRLRLEQRSRRVWVNEEEVLPPLSVSQFQLLELLYESKGRVVTRPELIQTVWGKENAIEISEQALDALVRRLRDRLAAADPLHAYLVTVRGHGLRLDNPPIN